MESTNNLTELKRDVSVARRELKNIRQQILSLKKAHENDVKVINEHLSSQKADNIRIQSFSTMQTAVQPVDTVSEPESWQFKPIGYIESVFREKNGTPRQSGVCPEARAKLTISHEIFTNPEHSLIGLEAFSHIWIVFVFHQNNGKYVGAMVKPPRLNGAKVGVYASRCPYRPNPIGLSLVKIEKIEDTTIHLLGIDVLDGTPVLDIKPYIPQYDSPLQQPFTLTAEPDVSVRSCRQTSTHHGGAECRNLAERGDDISADRVVDSDAVKDTDHLDDACDADDKVGLRKTGLVSIAAVDSSTGCRTFDEQPSQSVEIAFWVRSPQIPTLSVRFTPQAETQLELFGRHAADVDFQLRHFTSADELRRALRSILCADPRSVYRRKQCSDRLYYFTLDVVHVTCWFDGDVVEVLKLQPVSCSPVGSVVDL